MKITQVFIFLLAFSFHLTAQKAKNGNGNLETRTIEIKDFNKIVTNFPIKAFVTVGTPTVLTATTDSNLFDDIKMEVKDQTLYIEQIGWVEASAVIIKMGTPNLTNVVSEGYSNFIIKNLNTEEFELTNLVGKVTLDGKVDAFRFSMETGNLDASNLTAQEVYASVWSHGKATVNAIQLLDATVAGDGEINYINLPAKLKTHIKNNGEIISLKDAQTLKPKVQYISFKIQNNSAGRKHFYVKGPKGKRFSYGFPMNPFAKRPEDWPVGSKVYQVSKLGARKLLATIEVENAGQVVKLF